jgi:hypothetical protein
MSFRRNKQGTDLSKASNALEAIIARLSVEEDVDLVAAIQIAIQHARPVEVIDLWEQRQVALTYWILLLTGVNQEDEMRVAKDLLAWQSFFAKDSARVLCVQSSERESFRCCSGSFSVHDFPTLIFSDSPDMKTFIKVEPRLLHSLSIQPGGLQNFFVKLQSMIENGMSLQQVQDKMIAESFWKGVQVVYKEIKGLISIQISNSG